MADTKVKRGSQVCFSQIVRYENVLDILMSASKPMTVKDIILRLKLRGDEEPSEKQIRTIINYLSLEYDLCEELQTPDGRPSKSVHYFIENGKEEYRNKMLRALLSTDASPEKLAMLRRFADILRDMDDPEALRKSLDSLGIKM